MMRRFFRYSVGLLVLMGFVFLPVRAAFGQTASPAQIGVSAAVELAPEALVEIPIRVENVENLYAIDFELTFDPRLIAAQDADPASPGIQMGLGGFLDPGLLLYNTVDNERGVAHFVMTQVNPSEPKSGSGILLVLYVKALQLGSTELAVTNLQISDSQGNEIAASKLSSTVTVSGNAPPVSATAIPVVDPGEAIQIPTAGPSPAAPNVLPVTSIQQTPPAAAQPTGEALAGQNHPEQAPKAAESTPAAPAQTAGFSLLQHWWIVLIAVALVSGMGLYLARTRVS